MSGGPITWSSRKLNVIADSSALAEYSAASATSKELAFVRNILGELHVQLKGPFVLAVDNTAAIDVANNLGVTGRTKHFRSSIHYIRDEIMLQRLTMHHVRTDFQLCRFVHKSLG